jgi:hypothetical protein
MNRFLPTVLFNNKNPKLSTILLWFNGLETLNCNEERPRYNLVTGPRYRIKKWARTDLAHFIILMSGVLVKFSPQNILKDKGSCLCF